MKQVYDLTAADMERVAIWIFPMDETVEDEASVRPLKRGEVAPDGVQRIVRAMFKDRAGRVFPGYVYPGGGNRVNEARPVAWCDDVCITFWNGMIKPSADYIERIRGAGLRWPLTYEIDADGVQVENGTLDGIYYVDGNAIRCIALIGTTR